MNASYRGIRTSVLKKCISVLLCLSVLVPFAPNVLAVDTGNSPETSDSPETSVSSEFKLTEEQADSVISNVVGEKLPIVESNNEGYSYALTESKRDHLFSTLLADNKIDYSDDNAQFAQSNVLPENYIDNSNEDLNKYLRNPSNGIATFSVENKSEDDSDKKVDFVFVIDSTGSMAGVIRSVKNNVAQFAKYISDKGVSLRLGLIDFKDITDDGLDSTLVHTKSFSTWFDIDSFVEELTTISATGGGDTPETPIDALGYLTEETILWNSDAYKFAMLITDADYKNNNRHGIDSMSEMIEKLKADEIQVSVVTNDWCMANYGELAAFTGGVQAKITEDFGTLFEQYADTVIGSAQTKKDYILRINEKDTGLPVANAQISWNGGSAKTNASGIATITTRSNPVSNFKVVKDGYITYSATSFGLLKNACGVLELLVDDSDDSEDIPSDVPVVKASMFVDPGEVSDILNGPPIKILGKEFELYKVKMKLKLPLFDDVTVKHEKDDKKILVMIGKTMARGTDPNGHDPYWKEDYKKYKNLVGTFSGKSADEIYKEFRSMRKNFKASPADLAFPVDMYVGGYAEFSYADGSLQLADGGVIIGMSLKEKTIGEWPLAVPWIFFKLSFDADAKGRFSIITVDSKAKLAFSFKLKDIQIQPKVKGSLNLGVPKLASVGGGVNGVLKFKFSGLPPEALNKILTIKGGLEVAFYVKLLGYKDEFIFKETEEHQLYPSSKAKSANRLITKDIVMADFTPILPSNRVSVYSLYGLSDTFTFEKLAYGDSSPQIVPYGKGWMMVWIDSDGTRDETDHMALYYSIYTEENGWSTPALVNDDRTGDFSPSLVVSADGRPVVIWQNAKSVGDKTLEERLANIEILASVFNSDTNTFGNAISIPCTEGIAPLAVQAVADNDGISVYWLENSLNSPFLTDGTVSIMKCDFLTEETMSSVELKTNISGINGFAAGVMNGKDTYAYATTDGTNGMLFYDDAAYAIGNNCRSTQFVGGKLYWSDSEGFKSFDGTSVSIENIGVPADFTVVTDGVNRVILMDQFTGDIDSYTCKVYASVSTDGGAWSNYAEIRQYEGFLLGGMSAAMTDSGIIWVSGKQSKDEATLIVDEYIYAPKVDVAPNAYVSVLTRAPGEDIQVLVDLRNSGLVDVENLKARLADGTLVDMMINDEDGESIPLTTLSAGKSVTAAVAYTLPMDFTSNHEIVIDVVSNSPEGDIKWGTAKASIEGFPDLVVEDMSVSRNQDGTATVSATISNQGSIPAEAPSVFLTIEGVSPSGLNSENTKVLDDLAVDGKANITFEVAQEDIVALSPYDYKRVSITATTATQEYNVANNTDSVLLAPISVDSIAFVEDTVTLELGTTHSLNYQIFPANAPTSISFMSNDTNVVTVSDEGVLTPHKAGTTTVAVMAVEAEKVDEITVSVKGEVDVGVDGIVITPEGHTLAVGETVTLNASVLPENATNKSVIWSSDNPNVVSVTPDGLKCSVIGKNGGTAIVSAVTEDGGYAANCKITVNENMPGDLDKDGKVTILDVQILFNYVNEITPIPAEDIPIGDVDNDGKITILDVQMVFNHVNEIKPLC